jgi:hypothetical protein
MRPPSFRLAGRGASLAAALFLALLPATFGCSGPDQGPILTGGQAIDPALVDRDPMAVLPSEPVLLGYLDAATLFQSSLGPDVEQIVTTLVPLGREANFVPSRDISRVYGGIYAMSGADFCAVLQGNFDVEAIRRNADARAQTTSGQPLVKSRYAELDLYTVGNVGFVILTPRTVLSGNETGMRRALDRLRTGKIERSLPAWMTDLVATPNAAFTLAGDMSGQGAVEATTQKMPFMKGLKKIRTVGNFKPPGMNFAGSLTYADAQAAAEGAVQLQDLQKLTSFMSLLSSFGLAGPVPTMQVKQRDNDLAFTLPVDAAFARFLLSMLADVTRKATRGATPSSGWAWPLLTTPSR